MLRLILAWLHLVALGIGLGAVWVRARTLRAASEPLAIRRAFAADAWWGVAALVWIATGLWRLFGETEKPVGYYMRSHVFWTKMALLAVILLLEIWPMATLVRWRRASARGELHAGAATPAARRIATISYVQAVLVVAMVAAAVAMARGFGADV